MRTQLVYIGIVRLHPTDKLLDKSTWRRLLLAVDLFAAVERHRWHFVGLLDVRAFALHMLLFFVDPNVG